MEWSELVHYHLNPPPDQVHSRTPEVDRAYQQRKQELAKIGRTLEEEVIGRFFDFEAITKGWAFVPNDFPYNLAPGIKHYVLWIHPNNFSPDFQILNELDRRLLRQGIIPSAVVYYQNIPSIRSVPGIKHYQVFIQTWVQNRNQAKILSKM